MLQNGDLLGGRYKIDSLVAKGGMGCVYLVKDQKLNQKIWAVKEMSLIQNNELFLEEANLLSNLSHPSIPKISDFFEPDSDGNSYLVMEYINGVTLQKHFESLFCKLPFQDIVHYALQICEVLQYLHQQNKPIVFRDLKPANIMIDEYKQIKLIDFGIARKFDTGKLSDTVQMGTIAFAAPEQFENRQTDPRTDIYSLGAIIYYLASGGHYYFRNAIPLDQVLPDLPKAFLTVLQALLETDPDARYQTIQEVKHQLLLFQNNTSDGDAESEITRTLLIKPGDLQVHQKRGELVQSTSLAYAGSKKMHTLQATQTHPALVIYLLDVSGSMTLMSGEKRRLDVVTDSLYIALKQMVFRSTKGSRISSRYRVAIYAYSDEVQDVLGGVKSIDNLMHTGMLPTLHTQRFTDTAKAFQQAEQLLISEMANLQDGPAPLICHMTDGVYTGEDPEPIARRIMEMSVKDGNVLVENIFISDDVLQQAVDQPKRWQGVQDHTTFLDGYGAKLRRMSSLIPESYRQMMREANYNLTDGAYLMFPGTNPELVSLGFQMSAATPIH